MASVGVWPHVPSGVTGLQRAAGPGADYLGCSLSWDLWVDGYLLGRAFGLQGPGLPQMSG